MLPRGAAICPAHVDDVARGHLLAMEKGHPGESYIIGGPPVTVAEIFRLAERISGLRAPRIHLPAWTLRLSAVAVRPLELLGVRLPPLFTAEALRAQAGVTYMGSNAKAREELGHSVRPLEEGLREVISHLEAGG